MKNILKNVLEKFYENKILLNEENLNVIIQIISSGHLIDLFYFVDEILVKHY